MRNSTASLDENIDLVIFATNICGISRTYYNDKVFTYVSVFYMEVRMLNIKYYVCWHFTCLLFMSVFSLTITTHAYASSKGELFAQARIEVLKNQIFTFKKTIACQKTQFNSEKLKACIDQIQVDHPDKFKQPEILLKQLAELEKPTPSTIQDKCGHLPNDPHRMNGSYERCEINLKSDYFQTIGLLRNGIDPNSINDSGSYVDARPDTLQKIKNLEDENDKLFLRKTRSVFLQWKGLYCKAEAAKSPVDERPDCRQKYYFDGNNDYQYCRSIVESEHGTRGDTEIRWDYRYYDDENDKPIHLRRIKGRYADLHAIGGPWHDQYSSNAKVPEVILEFIPYDFGLPARRLLGCYVHPKVEEGEEPQDSGEVNPNMDVQISIYPSDTSQDSGRVRVYAEGTPPWEVSYTVQALRKSKWHLVAKEHLKFTKPKVEFIKDYYWYKAESWKLVDINK